MRRHPLRMEPATVAHIPPTIDRGIRIEHLAIISTMGYSDAVVITGDRREIADTQDVLLGVGRFSQKGHDGIGGVVKVHPLEAGPVVVDGMKGTLCSIQPIEISHKSLDSPMERILEKMPI